MEKKQEEDKREVMEDSAPEKASVVRLKRRCDVAVGKFRVRKSRLALFMLEPQR
jgi:hypothetical protein